MFKPLRMSDTAVVCSLDDPAIDWDAMKLEHGDGILSEVAKVARTQPALMLKRLVFKQGEQPLRFVIGVIPPDEMGRINDECAASGKMSQLGWRAFLSSLRGLDGWPEKPETKKLGDVEYIAADWIKRTFIRGLRDIATEVGIYAWAFNRLTDDEVRLS